MTEEYDLVICVFGCDTVEKYRNQILKINETWGKDAESNPNVKLLYFLGEEKTSLQGSQYINLSGVKNDYASCAYKQFLGLKYIHEHYTAKFTICAGTDTYINVPKLVNYLFRFNHKANLYIGGHGDYRQIIDRTVYFHSGGAGFVITQECLRQLYPKLTTITDDWNELCSKNNYYYYLGACDLAIAYYLQHPDIQSTVIKADDCLFNGCNYKGNPCHSDVIHTKNIITCHFMSLEDFDEFNKILKLNNYYV